MSDQISKMPMTWKVNAYSWEAAHRLAEALELPPVVGMVLAGRGLSDPAEARVFLECAYPLGDPFLFSGMQGAVESIGSAIDQGRRIVVHGDYDADGITATALMLLGLRDFGVEAEWYLPNRFEEGYGLSRRAVESIAAKGQGVLVTVDCGVNYPDEVALAQSLGLDTVVVDHHHPGPILPDCHLVHSVAGTYPHADLCGVGLAFKVMHALHIVRKGAAREVVPAALASLLDLVAVGTIADLASLRGENRYLVREGLKLIEIGQRVGLRALAQVSGCSGAVDSGTVAYRLAPRLNAAGRLADPSPPLRLLLTDDEREATALAAQLHDLNGARQDVERQIFEQAMRQVEAMEELPPALVLAAEEWHEGVVGIVASRMVERYHRPTILLGIRKGVAKGSGRSISSYDLLSGLTACERHLTVYGGHTQAVGLTLDSGMVEGFRSALQEHAGRAINASDLVPVYLADAVARGDELDAETASALATLGPFGSGNPRPRLVVVDAAVRDAECTRTGSHLRCTIEADGMRVRGIGFGMGELLDELRADPEGRIVGGQLRVDEWRGTLRPELLLERVGPVPFGDGWARECPGYQPESERPTSVAVAVASYGAEEHSGDSGLPPACDLRNQHGRTAALAQVLATRERVLMLTCSLALTVPVLRRRLPAASLIGGEVRCAGTGGALPDGLPLSEAVVLAEWDVAAECTDIVGGRSHIVVLDPPYRSTHSAVLWKGFRQGAVVHLLYGRDEREATERFLRHLVHPRFAMVCLFRAMQEGIERGDDGLARAFVMAREEAQVSLDRGGLQRAAQILRELGVQQHAPGEAKLDTLSSPTFIAAQAEYEECLRLCRTL
jgi:single-stranded-DNA-specific exonuclease